MIIAIAVVGGILGLANILMPRSVMLLGQRWTLKDGDRAEPSDLYVLYVRIAGVAILIASAGFALWMLSLEHSQAREAELEELWDVTLYPDDQVVVVADPPILTSYLVGDDQVALSPTRTAIVGRDELGDLGGDSTFDDGDLLVGMGYSACTFSHLIVADDEGDTVVAIVVDLPHVDPIPGVTPPDVDDSPSSVEDYNDILFCKRRFLDQGEATGLTVFRVPNGG